ncbi:MAG: hypothetical protein QM778_00490 [Myxococcales bacterium]
MGSARTCPIVWSGVAQIGWCNAQHYRQRLDLLAAAVGMSLIVHLSYIAFVWLVTLGIGIAPEYRPPASSIFVIVPPSMIAGALPIGSYEVVITLLLRAVSPPGAPPNMGLLVAMTYRIVQICIATIGLGYWLAGRREVRELMHEAKELPSGTDGIQPTEATAPSAI